MVKIEYSPAADRIKQLSRLAVRRFAAVNIRKSERKDMKMVCFPSVGFHDVYEISDPLGIPRYNVTGIERGAEVFRRMEKNNPGIRLFYGTDREFFETTKDKFGIIGLDYTGMMTPQKTQDLTTLFYRHLLSDRGILYTNFFGAREGESVKSVYERPFKMKSSSAEAIDSFLKRLEHLKGKVNIPENVLQIEKKVVEAKKVIDSGKMSILRDGITEEIIALAHSSPIAMAMIGMGFKSSATSVESAFSGEIMEKPLDFEPVKDLPIEAQQYFFAKSSHPYFCDNLERYRYRSNDGSVMLTDLFLFNTHKEWYDEKKYPIHFDGKEKIKCMISGKDYSAYQGFEPAFVNAQKHMFHVISSLVDSLEKINERTNLGSSTKPILSKDKARELIGKGVSSEEILKTYRGVTKHQLAAFKAHKTMKEKKQSYEDDIEISPKEEREALSDFFKD